jgi:hypothetical protein
MSGHWDAQRAMQRALIWAYATGRVVGSWSVKYEEREKGKGKMTKLVVWNMTFILL